MLMHGLEVVAVVVVLWMLLHKRARLMVICRNCGTRAMSRVSSPRSVWIEIILWLCGIIPGVIYSLWCYHNTYNVCSKCGSRDILPLDSPMGRKLAGKMAVDVTPMSEQNRS